MWRIAVEDAKILQAVDACAELGRCRPDPTVSDRSCQYSVRDTSPHTTEVKSMCHALLLYDEILVCEKSLNYVCAYDCTGTPASIRKQLC